jgi:hypothetical protein
MSVTTEQDKLSLISYGVPGPWVAMSNIQGNSTDVLGETRFHSGVLQALLGLYGGTDIMSVTYRPGVYADGSDLNLGALNSDAVSAGTQIYFVSLDNMLPVGETANGTPTVTSTNTALTLSAPAVNTAVLSTNDGSVVAPIGRAIEFRVTLSTSSFATTSAPILVNWESLTSANKNNCTVTLDIEFNA